MKAGLTILRSMAPDFPRSNENIKLDPRLILIQFMESLELSVSLRRATGVHIVDTSCTQTFGQGISDLVPGSDIVCNAANHTTMARQNGRN